MDNPSPIKMWCWVSPRRSIIDLYGAMSFVYEDDYPSTVDCSPDF